ncbi:MAG: DUF2309 domain-containing protein [Bryobacteraceae bacterium]|nr:DUF2309 domain-containing protein [Bryobacteraceae bacterium]
MKSSPDRREHLNHAVHKAAHLLPAQGPIGVFVHHNTLHAFQHLPFEEAVVAASEVYGTQPYMSENAYRQQIARKRILPGDVDAILAQEPNAEVFPGLDRMRLRRVLLMRGARQFQSETVQWHLDETDLLRRFRRDLDHAAKAALVSESLQFAVRHGADRPNGADAGESAAAHALFTVCSRRIEANSATRVGDPPPRQSVRPRDRILNGTGIDLDYVIHPLLIRVSAVYLDQGIAYWPMPDRERGFLPAVRSLFALRYALFPEYLDGLPEEFRRQGDADAEAVVLQILDRLGIPQSDWDELIQQEALALPGWAGLMYRLEEEPELAPHNRLPCTLIDFLAVRLTMVLVAASSVRAREPVRHARPDVRNLVSTVQLFDVAQLLGLSAPKLAAVNADGFLKLQSEMRAFDEITRRRILHLAYERRHEMLILLPLGKHARTPRPQAEKRPLAQIFFCLDEREESLRRHLEEVEPEIETLSAAGFFGVAVEYTGIDDAHGAALCPVVIKPQHAVREAPVWQDLGISDLRRQRRRLYSRLAFGTFVASRTLVRGWVSTAALGFLSLVPLVTRVLTPLRYARWREMLQRSFLPEPTTELEFIRADAEQGETVEGLLQGFSLQERVDRVAGVLGPAGLQSGFARLVVIFGHGSNSLNNPHESAHDCGACGGRRGGPNARLFAAMANDPEVRERLRRLGIGIPEDTRFIGGYHDTCNDDIDLYDLHLLPEPHQPDLDRLRIALDRARARDAHERSRRFEAAEGAHEAAQALHHVQERAQHLAEPRPEYGHCTNSVCIVGRRSTTRGLFLDRRAFLISYDAGQDLKDESLARILGAAVPVCAGISLEYYFSFVDNEGYGCGTKLPHNVTGLVGVMNGHASDLRTGLPWQMVEIHEPVRILFVVETTPERVMRAFTAAPLLLELLWKRWFRLATLDPDSGLIHVYRNGIFEPAEQTNEAIPSANTSSDWYAGRTEHLPVAVIEKGLVSLGRN